MQKDYRFIPIVPAAVNVLNAGSWLGYGIAINDINVIIPNAIGFGGAILLVITFAILKIINPGVGKEVLEAKDVDEALIKNNVNQNVAESADSITLE